MNALEGMYQSSAGLVPLLIVIAVVGLILWGTNWLLLRRSGLTTESRLPRQLAMLVFCAIGLIVVILALPVNETTRGELLSLLGLVLTGVIALSSTTLVSNVMAGLMLRSVKSFRHGDFVHAGEYFGRVTERGLFHTEIQTENRDLITLPNLYLSSNPVTVVRSSGTIISCSLSLGYDIPHHQLEPLLKAAAVKAGLQEPFMQIQELGDFSVVYRICGYYPEVKQLLTMRTKLRKEVLDHLHSADIEIVSPTFMNQRPIDNGEKFIAEPKKTTDSFETQHPAPESLIFDKADRAEKIRVLKEEIQSLINEKKDFQKQFEKAAEDTKPQLKSEISRREERVELLEKIIQKAKEKSEQEKHE